ncbi:MAG: fasciclin domain-containing protein [Bacteroidales bacterium]
MRRAHIFLLAAAGILLLTCCEPKQNSKYDRPEWLAGKVYTQLLDQPDLSTFARCVELTGYDTIINRSGSYTIFAPNNEAFTRWFQDNPQYGDVEGIPLDLLNEIVKFHIVQNPWSKVQLRSLDVYGWIDTLDLNNNKPRGFKRQTLLLDKNRKLGIEPQSGTGANIKIVDTTETNWHRIVATDSRKYAPIFYKEYLDIYDLKESDYEFYFDRTVDNPQDIYFAGGKIIGEEVFAENGFVYQIDRVNDPLPNAYQILENGISNKHYDKFLDLLNLFPNFQYDQEKTFDQPGADQGLEVDSLFDLTYPELAFDFLNEKTTPPTGTYGLPSNVTIRYHHGVFAPTNAAFDQFVNDYFKGTTHWGTLENAPVILKRIVANTHLSSTSVYPTDFENGFYNGEDDIVQFSASDIVEKQFGSNSTFIGLSNAVVPRVFKSVAGPVYLLKNYSKPMYAIEDAGLLSALKRRNENYLFYVENNTNTSADSSLLRDPSTGEFFLFATSLGSAQEFRLGTNDLRTLLMNHIATGIPTGLPRKEFFQNLAGNYIIINNETGEVKGTAATSVGYQGLELQPNFPKEISTESDNGTTYDVENWFSFTGPNIFQEIRSSYPVFHDLLLQAGLGNNFELRYTFLSENEIYTVFIPNDEVMSAFGADTLPREELQELLKLHFVQGSMIFTDGHLDPGYYETTRDDEKSTEFTKIFSKIRIQPGIDVIQIMDNSGGIYVETEESEVSNIMTGRDMGEGEGVYSNIVITGVLHEIDRVLVFDELDTN